MQIRGAFPFTVAVNNVGATMGLKEMVDGSEQAGIPALG